MDEVCAFLRLIFWLHFVGAGGRYMKWMVDQYALVVLSGWGFSGLDNKELHALVLLLSQW